MISPLRNAGFVWTRKRTPEYCAVELRSLLFTAFNATAMSLTLIALAEMPYTIRFADCCLLRCCGRGRKDTYNMCFVRLVKTINNKRRKSITIQSHPSSDRGPNRIMIKKRIIINIVSLSSRTADVRCAAAHKNLLVAKE